MAVATQLRIPSNHDTYYQMMFLAAAVEGVSQEVGVEVMLAASRLPSTMRTGYSGRQG